MKISVKNLKHFFISCLAALMVALACAGPAASFDGGDGDGGGDDGGFDDGGDDQGDGGPDDPGDQDHAGHDGDGRGHHGGHGGDRHHGHGHHRSYYGGYGWGWGPGFGPYGFGAFGYFPPYYPPFYGYPRVVVQPTAPPVYIEQQNPPAVSAPGANYWHYCQAEGGYYPEVKECPEGWVQIAPQNQSASPEQPGQP